MGTEISEEDLEATSALAEQVVDLTEHRQSLSSYLSTRMQALAPNLTALVGELVGARLIAHAGSLMNLAKSPGSTIQILGAEKALFRALKTKHDTPKYGLIYHASLIGQATGKNKGKIARMLAAKSALGLRIDALSTWGVTSEDASHEPTEEEKSQVGRDARLGIERRLRALEGKPLKSLANANQTPLAGAKKWEVKEARKYNPDADGLTGDEPAAKKAKTAQVNGTTPKKLVQEVESEDEDETMADAAEAEDSDSDDEESAKEVSKSDKKAAKKAEKEAKKARKAERAAKREAKTAKKAAKEAKKAEKDSKKRKRDDDGEKSEKKKKKSKA